MTDDNATDNATEKTAGQENAGQENATERLEAIQAVVDRVTSWQDGATEGTVEAELRKGFAEVGVEVSDGEVTKLTRAIEDEHGAVDAADVLG